MIINLTQHLATEDQKIEGVVDLPENLRNRLIEALTFNELPEKSDLEKHAQWIINILKDFDDLTNQYHFEVMIGGAPYFMPILEKTLREHKYFLMYAFSKRVSTEKVLEDGSVVKVQTFKHIGFVRYF